MSLSQYEPLITATATSLVVFGLAHLAKMVIDRSLTHHTRPHTFALEFITALQMCTCVYENGIIIANYGLLGFFFSTTLGLVAAGGHFGIILSHVEFLLVGNVSIIDFAVVLVGQFLGAACALKAATTFWYLTADLSSSHLKAVGSNLCAFRLFHTLYMVLILEAAVNFVQRFLIGQYALKTTWRRRYLIPVIVSAHLIAAIYLTGIAAINPMIAYARLAMCPGMNDIYFFLTHWAAATAGWLAGAIVQQRYDGWLKGSTKERIFHIIL